MDSSKISEECSSSESGWTMYIASPENEADHVDKDDEDDVISEGDRGGCKKDVEDADSDDSMASDASSGPSYGYFGHAGKRDESRCVDKKNNEEQKRKKKKHHEQIKAEKDKSGNRANSAGRSKKKV